MKPRKVVVGISGGVDSSVTALLLKQQGYDVTAVFMQNWEVENDDPYCTAEQDLIDAHQVCEILQIPLLVVNFAKEYWQQVFQYCLDEFNAGRTPNPDIFCNREIKFKRFLEYALNLGADYIATGHYAKIKFDHTQYFLAKAADNSKDQSYFLYTLGQKQLSHCLFPLADKLKSEVRQIATAANLPNHNKKDSTGICFIGERKFKDFLQEFLLTKPGPIKNLAGEILGQHDGLMFYTIGQRKGLALGGKKNSLEKPWYVIEKNIAENILIVDQGQDHPALFASNLLCQDLHWVAGKSPELPLECTAKIRYRQQDQVCSLNFADDGKILVNFKEPQRAITPGQAIVFYQNDICLGGGTIVSAKEIGQI